jgi:hypothetical protein
MKIEPNQQARSVLLEQDIHFVKGDPSRAATLMKANVNFASLRFPEESGTLK